MATVTAIRAPGGWLWDGTGREPIRDGVVLYERDRILAVGRMGDLAIPEGAELIERGDEFIMPGLIDAHTHITIIPGLGDQSGQTMQPVERQVLRGAGNLRRQLRSGVTTARIMGEQHWIDVTMRAELARGTLPGPRLVISTRALTPSNGHGRSLVAFDGVDEVRKGARENLYRGADFIKIFITGGISSTSGKLNAASYTREEVRAAVEEAERAGTYVAAHAHGGEGLRICVEEGVRTIEHAALISDDELAMVRDSDAWLVLTQAIYLHPTGIEQGDRDNPEIMARLQEARARVAETYRTIVASGVRYAVGTDSMHGLLPFEAARLVDWGASTNDALLAATRWAAACCQLDDRGTLAPGKLADIITVRGNPLQNIAALERLGLIVKGGQRYDHLSAE